MDWFDRFEQRIVGSVGLFSTLPHLVSIMPPADQTWGSDGRTGRWLDVTLAQCDTGKLTLKSAVMDRTAIIGLRVPHAVVRRILCERDSVSKHAGAKHDFVEWSAKNLRVRRGCLQCLGQKLSAEGKTLVAFVRVR